MAELISLSASVISLVQGIELARKSWGLICDLKSAPAEAKQIATDLQQVQAIVQEVDRFARQTPPAFLNSGNSARLLQLELNQFLNDIERFRNIVDCHGLQDTGWSRIKIRIKWAAGLDKKLTQISRRLVEHGGRLQLALSLCSNVETRASSVHISRQLNEIEQLQRQQLLSIAPSINNSTSPWAFTSIKGSATTCAEILNAISPTLYRLLSNSSTSIGSASEAEWVVSRLVYGVLSDAISGRLKASLDTPLERAIPESPSSSGPSPGPPGQLIKTIFFASGSRPTLHSMASMEIQEESSHVNLTLQTHRVTAAEQSAFNRATIKQGRLYVEMKTTQPSVHAGTGTVITVFESTGNQTLLLRYLTTFARHPRDSPVFTFIKDGNTAAIQRLLSLRTISPNDRDEDGRSLLWHCVSNPSLATSYDICELLLRENADPSDCNRNGDHVASVVITQIAHNHQLAHGLRLIDLFVRYSPIAEGFSTIQYKRRKGIEQARASLLHATIAGHRSGKVTHVPHLLAKLISGGADVEMADKHGNTALLYALFYVPWMFLPTVALQLLDGGADVHAKNSHGEGALHLLLRRLSACSVPNTSQETKARIVDVLERLILKGCDPVTGNIRGYTPIDAAMSPVAWPIFCAAIAKAGRNMNNELQLLDMAARVDILETEIEEKTQDTTRQRAAQKNPEVHEHILVDMGQGSAICQLCKRGPDPSLRDAPFDEFFSDLVDELGQGIHMVMNNHDDFEECLHVHEEDSTHPLDYHPSEMSPERLKERSWRRHVAWRLWERGLLDA
ncbi:hypothetical protein QBC43DRAFT_326346 [Cladorrhinum sp. PSN259]|nr:hypothetical protein QBC43DRAFT_326346 [Cladorrhinum sp. PSN259]